MITNREEVLENALRVFAKMNYEKASLVTIAKACGLSKWGLIYYYSFKQDLFVAVVDKYIFATQDPDNKFSFRGGTLLEFIDHHVESVEKTMRRIVGLLDDGNNPQGCSYNFYYFHLLMQVRQYYPDAGAKFAALFEKDRKLWRDIIERAKSSRHHRAGKVVGRSPRGGGHGGNRRHVPRGVLRLVFRAGFPLRAGHGRTFPQAPLHLFTD